WTDESVLGDGSGASAKAQFFRFDETPEVANPIPDQTFAEDTAWSYQFAAGAFSDADNDPLTYTATLANGAALPAWLSFHGGTISIKVTASDGAATGSDTFLLTVAAHSDGGNDFSRDGFADILLRNDNGTVGLWEMNGAVIGWQGGIHAPLSSDWHIEKNSDF